MFVHAKDGSLKRKRVEDEHSQDEDDGQNAYEPPSDITPGPKARSHKRRRRESGVTAVRSGGLLKIPTVLKDQLDRPYGAHILRLLVTYRGILATLVDDDMRKRAQETFPKATRSTYSQIRLNDPAFSDFKTLLADTAPGFKIGEFLNLLMLGQKSADSLDNAEAAPNEALDTELRRNSRADEQRGEDERTELPERRTRKSLRGAMKKVITDISEPGVNMRASGLKPKKDGIDADMDMQSKAIDIPPVETAFSLPRFLSSPAKVPKTYGSPRSSKIIRSSRVSPTPNTEMGLKRIRTFGGKAPKSLQSPSADVWAFLDDNYQDDLPPATESSVKTPSAPLKSNKAKRTAAKTPRLSERADDDIIDDEEDVKTRGKHQRGRKKPLAITTVSRMQKQRNLVSDQEDAPSGSPELGYFPVSDHHEDAEAKEAFQAGCGDISDGDSDEVPGGGSKDEIESQIFVDSFEELPDEDDSFVLAPSEAVAQIEDDDRIAPLQSDSDGKTEDRAKTVDMLSGNLKVFQLVRSTDCGYSTPDTLVYEDRDTDADGNDVTVDAMEEIDEREMKTLTTASYDSQKTAAGDAVFLEDRAEKVDLGEETRVAETAENADRADDVRDGNVVENMVVESQKTISDEVLESQSGQAEDETNHADKTAVRVQSADDAVADFKKSLDELTILQQDTVAGSQGVVDANEDDMIIEPTQRPAPINIWDLGVSSSQLTRCQDHGRGVSKFDSDDRSAPQVIVAATSPSNKQDTKTFEITERSLTSSPVFVPASQIVPATLRPQADDISHRSSKNGDLPSGSGEGPSQQISILQPPHRKEPMTDKDLINWHAGVHPESPNCIVRPGVVRPKLIRPTVVRSMVMRR